MSNQSLFINTNLTVTSLSRLGVVDNLAIENTIGEAKGTRGKYRKYTNENRFKIGKFASQNGVTACVRRCNWLSKAKREHSASFQETIWARTKNVYMKWKRNLQGFNSWEKR